MHQEVRRELVAIDTSAEGYQQLVDDLLANEDESRQFDVFLLNADRDGIEQISEILVGFDDVETLHIVSHGTDGAVKLGNSWLSMDNVGGYAGQLVGWRDALAADADLLVYGCDLASNEDGQTLIESLSALTDADVAASVDETGNALLGGDWDLEFESGSVESNVAFSATLQSEWSSLLDGAAISQDGVDGSSQDDGNAIAVSASGEVYLAGTTRSSDLPITGGVVDSTLQNTNDAFVAKLNAAGNSLDFATFLGESALEEATGIAVDGSGNVYVAGNTTFSDWVTTGGAYDQSHNGSYDTFVVKLNSTATSRLFSTLLGGSAWDKTWDLRPTMRTRRPKMNRPSTWCRYPSQSLSRPTRLLMLPSVFDRRRAGICRLSWMRARCLQSKKSNGRTRTCSKRHTFTK